LELIHNQFLFRSVLVDMVVVISLVEFKELPLVLLSLQELKLL